MLDFVKWLLFGLVLGWISTPLTWRVFKKLPSRAYYLAKPVGLLTWGFLYWLFVSLGLMKNNLASQLTVLLILILINGYLVYKIGWQSLWTWLRDNVKIIIWTELVFLVFFGFWAVVRASNPDIIHTEKFMEMAFINGILRSDTFPPLDPWLSGYGISYYYFGYVLSAMLIRVTNVAASVGYNLVSAFCFGLVAVGAYGILYDLIVFSKKGKETTEETKRTLQRARMIALLAPVMLLFVSNLFGALDVAHSRGLAWDESAISVGQAEFWDAFNIEELKSPPRETSWRPNRGGWSWWQASRVLRDTSLSGHSIEVIDEFPQFTFLLADIHPHMLGMPFVLIAIALALNFIHGGAEGRFKMANLLVAYEPLAVFFAVLTLGGIAFMNTWDFPFYLALIAATLVYRRYLKDGWNGKRIIEFFGIVIICGLLSILIYLPFYLSFASQAGGILPSLAFFTPGINFWVMFAPLLVPISFFLLYLVIKKKAFKELGLSVLIVLALFAFLFVFSWGIGWLGSRSETTSATILGLQGAPDSRTLLTESIRLRLKSPGTAITLFALLSFSLALVLDKKKIQNAETNSDVIIKEQTEKPVHLIFVLFLIILGALLTLAPEFVYLRDQFSWRMNTIFKFYFQAWILWSLAASYAIVFLFGKSETRRVPNSLFVMLITGLVFTSFGLSLNERSTFPAGFGALRADWLVLAIGLVFLLWIVCHLIRRNLKAVLAVVSVLVVLAGLIYPILEIWNKTEGFQPRLGFTLDGKRFFWESYPDAMRAAEWLETAPMGVLAEAVADQGGSYTTYNLISTFSGMPSVLGWVGHEHQWRGGGAEVGTRQQDLRELYSTKNMDRFKEIILQYNIRYIVYGNYERDTYRVSEPYFSSELTPVFESDTVTIYEVRQ